MKVIDHTYSRGSREEITTSVDIGIATECLAECTRLGSQCLAVTLQVGISGLNLNRRRTSESESSERTRWSTAVFLAHIVGWS